jgi:DNA-binding CsgD family transcriptional regulator/tetratricopeptide (TPR) repeat protein
MGDHLIGRTSEVNRIERWLGLGGVGVSRALLLEGTAGTGKSALLQEARVIADKLGCVSCFVRVPHFGGMSPLFPIDEVFAGLQDSLSNSSFHSSRLDSPSPPLFVQTVADLGGNAQRASDHPIDGLRLARALEAIGSHRQVAIFLDDIQWASAERLATLLAAIRANPTPICLAVTRRSSPGESAISPDWITGSDLQVDRMLIGGLDAGSVSQLAERLLGGPVLKSLTDELDRQTAGNPLFVQETLRSWASAEDVLQQVGGYWGFTTAREHAPVEPLLQMIADRARRLPAEARDLASVVAILGKPATPSFIQALTETPEGALLENLSTLEDEAILERRQSREYAFTHPLFQAAFLQLTNQTRRASIHQRIFEVLRSAETMPSAAELAYHATRSLNAPPDLSMILSRAATEAESVGSYADAAGWYKSLVELASNERDRAKALAGQADATSHFDGTSAVGLYTDSLRLTFDSRDKFPLLIGRSRAYRKLGDASSVLKDLAQASEIADGANVEQVRFETAIMHALFGDLKDAHATFSEIAASGSDPLVRARAKGSLAMSASMWGDQRTAAALTREALLETNHVEHKRYLLNNLGWFLVLLGEWKEARELLEGAIKDAEQAYDLWNLAAMMTTTAQLATWEGKTDEAVDRASRALSDANLMQKQMDQVVAVAILGEAFLTSGRPQEALKAMVGIPSLIEETIERHDVVYALVIYGEACLRCGDISAAEDALQLADSMVRYNTGWAVAVDRLRSQIALACRDVSGALEICNPWMEAPSQIAFEQGRIHEEGARAYRLLKATTEALSQAQAAKEIYETIGAVGRLAEVQSFIQMSSPHKVGRPQSHGPGELTDREVEILELVKVGRTNSEIASELFISQGTVKKHLDNIKRKLGRRRRSELAAYASLGPGAGELLRPRPQ